MCLTVSSWAPLPPGQAQVPIDRRRYTTTAVKGTHCNERRDCLLSCLVIATYKKFIYVSYVHSMMLCQTLPRQTGEQAKSLCPGGGAAELAIPSLVAINSRYGIFKRVLRPTLKGFIEFLS